MILNLVSGPRNISTALMYAFAQRGDTRVMDEPFYAVYLASTGAPHPGAAVVLRSMSQHEADVQKQIADFRSSPVLFIKNMSHHMEVLERPFPDGAVNIFLIRDPAQIISSYAAVIRHPVMRDIGIEYQYNLFSGLREKGATPVVLDSGYLLENPAAVLKKLCHSLGLAYDQRMVHWPPGPKPYDGVWAPHWYGNVHRTTGFERQATSSRPLPSHLQELHERARAFYQKLLPFSLKA